MIGLVAAMLNDTQYLILDPARIPAIHSTGA